MREVQSKYAAEVKANDCTLAEMKLLSGTERAHDLYSLVARQAIRDDSLFKLGEVIELHKRIIDGFFME